MRTAALRVLDSESTSGLATSRSVGLLPDLSTIRPAIIRLAGCAPKARSQSSAQGSTILVWLQIPEL
jgi:hypothetical protein